MAKPLGEYTLKEHASAAYSAWRELHEVLRHVYADTATERDLQRTRLEGEAFQFHLHHIERALAARFEPGPETTEPEERDRG